MIDFPAEMKTRRAAEYMTMSYSKFKTEYPSWIKFGVIPMRQNGHKEPKNRNKDTRPLIFKRIQLDVVKKSWEMVKGA